MDAKEEFMRQWGVSGMPADKIRLANAAWDDATKAEREACAKLCETTGIECAEAIRVRSNAKLRGE